MIRMSSSVAGLVVLAMLGAGACSTSQSPVCESVAAVQNSVDRIRDTNVSENGLSQLKTDLTQLKVDLEKLTAEARTEFAAEIEAVRSAMTQLSASVTTARNAPDAANLAAVRPALNALQTSAQNLAKSASETC